MISTIKMKISVIGSSRDTEFFILRSLHLKKEDFNFSVFDSRESQNRLRNTYSNVETPWNIEDVINGADILINGYSIKNTDNFFEIIKNNNINLPIIDMSVFKEESLKSFALNQISNSVLHIMPPGKMNFDYKKDILRLPVVLNNKLNVDKNKNIDNFLKKLKLNFKFIDIEEIDSLVLSQYIIPNLYLLFLKNNMQIKSKIISNNFNQDYLLEFSELIDYDIVENININILNKMHTNETEFIDFIENLKKNNFVLNDDEFSSASSQEVLNIPKSKDTLLSLFFGEKFSKVMSSWGKSKND